MPRRNKATSAPDADGESGGSRDEGYIEAFGRHYHPSGRIYLPFDEDEQQRMRKHHRLFRLCLSGALTATRLPLDVKNMLDLGTGIGLWPIEMAARYPQARIMGIDASPIQKTTGVPPNVRFAVDNVENPWPCPDASIDFVHARCIAGGVHDWPRLLAQAFDKLKPGGLLELTELAITVHDFDRDFAEGELYPDFLNMFNRCCQEVGLNYDPTPTAPDWLLDTGFEKIVQRSEILPLGNWAGDNKLRDRQSLMNDITYTHFVNPCGLLFAQCGWSKEEFDAVRPAFFEEVAEYKPYCRAVFTTARKPRE
ncbi:S-adenosyl-L-methionine-dependent methyltransferase [Xylariaceae sp. FL0804]|nr:S-adenosyl-L-methionine-dependent methyltransferase [Xylariaceae sp. FL0804]